MSALPRIIAYEHALCLGKGWKNHEEIPIYPSPCNFFYGTFPKQRACSQATEEAPTPKPKYQMSASPTPQE